MNPLLPASAAILLLLSAGVCTAASPVVRPAPISRCAPAEATPGVDPEDPESVRRWRGGPPIFQAMGRDRHARLRALLAKGADPDVCVLGFSVLELAVSGGDLEEVRILVDAGAHLDLPRDSAGGTPLLGSLQLGKFQAARLLIERGADVRVVADGNVTALYALASAMVSPAAFDDQAALAREILDRGVAVNAAMGKPRITALMMAAIRGNKPLVEVLLERGADARLQDDQGQTALTFARKKGHSDIAEVLMAADSSPSSTQPSTEQRTSP